EPRVERTFSPETRQRPVRLDERFLRHVLDLRRVAHQARQQPPQLALVLRDQQLEGALVTPLRSLYEQLIDFAITHPRAFPESMSLLYPPNGGRGGPRSPTQLPTQLPPQLPTQLPTSIGPRRGWGGPRRA